MSFLGERWPAGWRLAWPGDDVGHLYKGCAQKNPWEEDFLVLLYHMPQSSILAWYIGAGRGKRSLFPSCPHLPARKRSKLGMTCPAGRFLQRSKLKEHLEAKANSVRFYPLCANCVEKVEAIGYPPPKDELLFVV